MEIIIILVLIIIILILIFRKKEKFEPTNKITPNLKVIPNEIKLNEKVTVKEYIDWLFKNALRPINKKHRDNLLKYIQGINLTEEDILPFNLPEEREYAQRYRFIYLSSLKQLIENTLKMQEKYYFVPFDEYKLVGSNVMLYPTYKNYDIMIQPEILDRLVNMYESLKTITL